jgi:hypothetical protein
VSELSEADPGANRSVLGRLLEELSWAGSSIRGYRQGGRGYENVLTAEVLGALDFLPRTRFLGAVISAAHGADRARQQLIAELEDAELVLLPPEIKLRASAPTYQAQLVVQPDGWIETPTCRVLIEAKRIRASSFQPEQLARQYAALWTNLGPKTPLLLLILGSPPPITVKGTGKTTPEAAVGAHLAAVLARSDRSELDSDTLLSRVSDVVAWITWDEINAIVTAAADSYPASDPSVRGTIARLTESVVESIARHA